MKHTNHLLRYGSYVFSIAGARTAGILISSATFPYLVRKLGVQGYGYWSYVIAVCAFLTVLSDPGLTTFLTQQLAAHREHAFDCIVDVLFLRLMSSAIAGIILLLVVSLEIRTEVRFLLKLYGLGILFVNLLSCDYILTALEMFHFRSVLTVAQQSAYALGIFAFVRSSADIKWVALSILLSSSLTALIGWTILLRRGVKLRARLRPRSWRGILVPSTHYAASTLMSSIYHRTGHLIVRWMLGDFALGIYAAATRFVDLLRGFVTIVLQVLMPRIAFASQSGQGVRKLAKVALAGISIVSIPLCAGLIATSHLLVPWLMGTAYTADISLLRWVAPYLVTAPAASLFAGTILFAMGRHRAYLAATAVGAACGVILNFVLTPWIGLIGAALAFVLAEVAVAGVAFAKVPELWDSWRSPAIAASVVALLPMLLAVRVANAYTSQVGVVIVSGACFYIAVCGWFVRRLVSRESFGVVAGN